MSHLSIYHCSEKTARKYLIFDYKDIMIMNVSRTKTMLYLKDYLPNNESIKYHSFTVYDITATED